MGPAADHIAVVAGQESAEGPEEEADADGGERQQQTDGGAGWLDEQLREHQAGGRGVNEEVVPFNGGADDGSEGDTTLVRLRTVGGRAHDSPVGVSGIAPGESQGIGSVVQICGWSLKGLVRRRPESLRARGGAGRGSGATLRSVWLMPCPEVTSGPYREGGG
jgi:hypothetical protein